MSNKYVRLSKTYNKGELIPYKEFCTKKVLKSYVNKFPGSDWYTSLFIYGEEVKELFEKTGSVSGYNGPAFADRLVFDFDDKENLEKAKLEVISFLNKLKEDGFTITKNRLPRNVRVFFSGCKGFHVMVPLKSMITREQAKNICTNLGKPYSTFDNVIYDINRLIRIPGTKHQETGLYKIELNPVQLKEISIEEIKKLAKNAIEIPGTIEPIDTELVLQRYYIPDGSNIPVVVDIPENLEEGIRGLSELDINKCPKDVPRCIYALSQGIMLSGKGERNSIFLHLGNYYRNLGLPREAVEGILLGIAKANHKLYPEHKSYEEEVKANIIGRVFNNPSKLNPGGWGVDPNFDLFKKYCDAIESDRICPIHGRDSSKSVVKIDDISESFTEFAKNFEKNIVKTGIKFIDKYMKLSVGTTTLLAGAAGVGKTTMVLNILENANRNGMTCLFFSLDMHKTLVYLKLATKLTHYTQEEITNFYKTNNETKMKEIREAIAQKYNNTFFDFSGTLSVEDMINKIVEIEKKHNLKIKFVVVDYASRIAGPYSEAYANATYNALKSKEAADITNTAWIILTQISRQSGDSNTPLRTKRAAKDSGAWEESASNVITMWRPFAGTEEDDNIVRLFLAKNRMGRELERPLWWNGTKGTITDMTDIEYEQYKIDGGELKEEEFRKSKIGIMRKDKQK